MRWILLINGKLSNFTHGVMGILLIGSEMLSSMGVSFFCILGISGAFIHVPYGFLHCTSGPILQDYYRLIWYLIGPFHHLRLHRIPVSDHGLSHFADVQHLVHCGLFVTIMALFIFVLSYLYEKNRYQLWKLIPLMEQLLVILVTVAVLIVVSFQDSFLWLHYHLFNNLNWVFTVNKDPIILILNLRFFLTYFVVWFLLWLFFNWVALLFFKR